MRPFRFCGPAGIRPGRMRVFDGLCADTNKASIVHRAFVDNPDPSVPASLLRSHPDLRIMLDKDAALKIV